MPAHNGHNGHNGHAPERIDGRRARGERTRLKVLESLLALVDAGELRPTAQQVAMHAGVALRTVYHHFEDVEALRNTALSLQVNRHRKVLETIDPSLPLDERAHQLARQCRRIYEAITPIRRAALFDENAQHDHPDGFGETLRRRREQIAEAFSPELSTRSSPKEVLDAADAASSWQTWYYLRAELGRSAIAAERVIATTITDLFSSSR